jgi:hypothetical protein
MHVLRGQLPFAYSYWSSLFEAAWKKTCSKTRVFSHRINFPKKRYSDDVQRGRGITPWNFDSTGDPTALNAALKMTAGYFSFLGFV